MVRGKDVGTGVKRPDVEASDRHWPWNWGKYLSFLICKNWDERFLLVAVAGRIKG